MRKVELPLLVQVTLETGFGRFVRIHNGAARAAGLIVDAPWSVARLAANVRGVVARRLESRVCRGLEIPDDLIVALGASLRSHEFGARYVRRRQHGPVDRSAGDGDKRHGQHDGNREQPSANDVSLPGIALLSRQIGCGKTHRAQLDVGRPLSLYRFSFWSGKTGATPVVHC